MKFLVVLLFLCIFESSVAATILENCTPPFSSNNLLLETNKQIEEVSAEELQLEEAIKNPEYLLKNWIELPTSPKANQKTRFLSLREAILLALRYNPNIKNAELDRIIQRYQLRLAHNEFELQYALSGTAFVEKSHYSDVGSVTTKNYLLTPELDLKTKLGSQLSLKMDNNVAAYGNYNPLLNLSFSQPLLRGFGKDANEAGLLNAIDNEWMNKVNLRQSIMDQITQVILIYRSLVLSGNNLQNQRQQLQEAETSFQINEKRINAGQLEPTGNIQQSYQIESLKLTVEQAENDFRNTSQDLLQALGLDPDMKIAVPNDVSLNKIIIPKMEDALAVGLAHNNQYLALQNTLKADERAYKMAKNQQLWQLDFNANIQAGTMTGVDSTSPGVPGLYKGHNIDKAAGITLTIPINDVSSKNQLITAKVQLEKDRINLIAAKRALITSIKNTISNIESQAKRYELAKRQVELALRAYTLEKKKQQAGISSALDVNSTQNQLLLAQRGLISAKVDYLNQLALLQRLLGTTLDYWKIKLRYC
ncbi:Outer membrane protein (plasmid) [Legionella adelaidensis]|uniref:Outer membrane efflux protein n=1 Tax=Legionella adelaidensis TaxID=45056 RepID=A0A0W0R0S5_9GAMM|nr:TolC family protein [Legionella adelaidensis]KTC64637.1 outer membrane efflux protein [Legionella adelaidensis]VEH86105.1 Outer membrane protein [Legionella adelaidensis]